MPYNILRGRNKYFRVFIVAKLSIIIPISGRFEKVVFNQLRLLSFHESKTLSNTRKNLIFEKIEIDLMQIKDNTRTSCAVIPLLFRMKKMGKMQDHIDRVRADADAREAEDPNCKRCQEEKALCEYYELLQNINLSPGGLAGITPQQLNRISFIASQDIALAANFRNLKDYLEEREEIETLWQPINFGNIQKNMVIEKPAIEAVAIKEDPKLLLYPNPTSDQVMVQYTLTNPKGRTNVSIYDLTGRKLKTEILSTPQGSVQFSTTNIPNGVYLIVLSDDNGRHKTGKLVVRH